jgi:CRP-like cAMP-binding protein
VLEQKESHPQFSPKSEEERQRILECIEDNILFNALDSKQMNVILDAMQTFHFKSGSNIIVQGEEGDYFYVMDEGEAECYVSKDPSQLPKLVKTYTTGETFGELALMYNSPRAATIKAKTDVKCWALDRVSFRNLLMSTTGDKQKRYESFLHKVPILQSLDQVELRKIADALTETIFLDGEYAVRQGEKGDRFFIISEGDARVFKTYDNGTEVELAQLSVGDVFGELALITDNPRAANVIAVGKLSCVTLDRGAFTRLLGPIQDILQRNKESYEAIERKLYQEKLERIRGQEQPAAANTGRKFSQRRRTAVSAEPMALQGDNKKFPVFPKNEIQKAILMSAIGHNTVLQSLDMSQQRIVIDAMFEKHFEDGQVMIKQGTEGDNFYVLVEGKAECFVESEDQPPLLVKTYSNGDSFGELALMYNSPRAATIIAAGPVHAFALDRQTFRQVMMETTNKKRMKYESFLSKVGVLQSLDRNERAKIADALEPVSFHDGDYVITQGEAGDAFYIVEEGNAIATKAFEEGREPVEVYRFQTGDCFGELALLNDMPRAANVIALGELKCLRLDRSSFVRLMGPCDEILKRNSQNYAKVEEALKVGSTMKLKR